MKGVIAAAVSLAKAIQDEVDANVLPPAAGASSDTDKIVYFSLVTGTRGYIEQIVHQINGAYAYGWYDACAVMIRRLVETLIIETFEAYNLSSTIQTSQGDFLYLSDLIPLCVNETVWNMGRNAKKALPRLKDIGDKSAHSRRFVAQRQDIDAVTGELRVVVQELLFLSKLKV
jgi:hypothetical protein